MLSSAHVRLRLVTVTLTALVVIAACGREEPAPAATTVTQSPQQEMTVPTTVTGCVRAGETADTFVLTTAQTTGGQTATYRLVGTGDLNLREHIGRRVEIQGVVRSGQSVALRSTTDEVPPASGTGGQKPAVSTSTELELKELQVREVRPVAGDFELK